MFPLLYLKVAGRKNSHRRLTFDPSSKVRVEKNNSRSNVNFGLKKIFKTEQIACTSYLYRWTDCNDNRANDDLKENFKFCIKCYKVQI